MLLKCLEEINSKLPQREKKHFRAAIASENFKASCIKLLVSNWIDQLKILPKLAKSETQSAYSAFVGNGKGKLMYYMGTIPCKKDYLIQLV